MKPTIYRVLAGALVAACSLGITAAGHAQTPKVIKISHQFPASTGEDGDFRDRLAKKFAAEVEKRTNGATRRSRSTRTARW